jgi:protein O-GlcNAc transferase
MPTISATKSSPSPHELSHLVALFNSGRYVETEDQTRLLIERDSESGFLWKILGASLQAQGKHILPVLQKAADLLRNDAEAFFNLGFALQELGQLENAAASYRQALKIKPDIAKTHLNLGNVLYHMGQSDNAVASYLRALEIEPDFAEAHFNLGNVLYHMGQSDNAVASYLRALEIEPDYAEAHCNLGNILLELGQIGNAMASCRRALDINPDFTLAHDSLGNILLELGQIDNAVASYRRALDINPDFTLAHDGLLFALNYSIHHTHANYLEQARKYGQIVAGKVGAPFSTWQCTAQPVRLRVGLVSGDLRIHSVGHFLESLLTHIDDTRIELIAYPTCQDQDELTARIRPYFSGWKPLGGERHHEENARLVHADGVHILIDLSGHTKHNCLPMFAWKPAPVQVTWLGLPATTGVAEIDYVLGDPWAIPAEYENQFSEAIWRMPESYVCLTVPSLSVNIVLPPALATGQMTFGSFNNLTKMNDRVVEVWARILQSVPNSKLLLKARQLGDAAICEQTLRRFADNGIAPEQLQLGGPLTSREEHLAAYSKVDIALDTFPYPGVTTSIEALWMGVPVLSLKGDNFLSCTAVSIAHNAGLADWIAADEDEYVAKAIAFASDPLRLSTLRANLRDQVLVSPLFDAPRFARNFEDALWGMWQVHQNQLQKSV